MQVIHYEDNDDNYYINRIIMIPEMNGLNSFYKVITHTNKMFCIQKLKTETSLYKTNEDSNVYQAKILDEFENEKIRKIRKTSIDKYPVIYCVIVQYEI